MNNGNLKRYVQAYLFEYTKFVAPEGPNENTVLKLLKNTKGIDLYSAEPRDFKRKEKLTFCGYDNKLRINPHMIVMDYKNKIINLIKREKNYIHSPNQEDEVDVESESFVIDHTPLETPDMGKIHRFIELTKNTSDDQVDQSDELRLHIEKIANEFGVEVFLNAIRDRTEVRLLGSPYYMLINDDFVEGYYQNKKIMKLVLSSSTLFNMEKYKSFLLKMKKHQKKRA